MSKLQKTGGLAALSLLCLATLVASPALGSTFIALGEEELVAQSDTVIQGKVLAVESFWDPTGRVIMSEATVRVDETIAGVSTKKIIKVETFGGQVGDFHVEAIGFPRFEKGEDVVLFLNQREALDHATRVTGFQQGQYRIMQREGKTLAIPAYDGGATLVRPDGSQVQLPQALPLEELKARVRTIATRPQVQIAE